MKRYIKQKVFSWEDRFSIFDERGEELYFAKGEVFSLGKKLHLYQTEDTELAFIRQKVFCFLPTYAIEIPGREPVWVKKSFTLLRPEYQIPDLGWTVSGDFTGHAYEIKKGEETLVRVSKKWFAWGDSYEINISEKTDEITALCVVLVIDAALASQNAA